MKTKERLSEVRRQGSSAEDSNFLSPLEQVGTKVTNKINPTYYDNYYYLV